MKILFREALKEDLPDLVELLADDVLGQSKCNQVL